MVATSPSTITASLACKTQTHLASFAYRRDRHCSCTAPSTDLESVLTVKLEAVLYSFNLPIIYDLTRLGVAFRDLEQAVCGRDKLVVTCDARGDKRESINASE